MDALKNVLLAGLGVLGYSQEKAASLVQGLVEKGELTREQGEKVIQEWVKKGEEEREKLGSKFDEQVESVIAKLPVVSRDQFDALEARVKLLEAKLESGN